MLLEIRNLLLVLSFEKSILIEFKNSPFGSCVLFIEKDNFNQK